MTVSFTGIKNVGYLMDGSAKHGIYNRAINIQVTNDEDGNDLDEFNRKLKETKTESKYHMDTPGLISFLIVKTSNHDNTATYDFMLNHNELILNDSTLPIFEYLAKISRQVSNMKEKEMVLEEDIVENDEIYDNTFLGNIAEEYGEKEAKRKKKAANKMNMTIEEAFGKEDDIKEGTRNFYMNWAYTPAMAVRGAKFMDVAIGSVMKDYFS